MKMYDNDFEIKEDKTWIIDKTDPPNILKRWILIAQATQLHLILQTDTTWLKALAEDEHSPVPNPAHRKVLRFMAPGAMA